MSYTAGAPRRTSRPTLRPTARALCLASTLALLPWAGVAAAHADSAPGAPGGAAAAGAVGVAGAAGAAGAAVDHRGPGRAQTSLGTPVDLGVLFVGAHPDDEAGTLSTLGEWKQRYGVRTGVITVTRGEGGGNAAGPQEGPALGLLREAEERGAVGMAGITDVFNLDKVDFYYTVSEPLTAQVWDHEDTLARTVRIIRQTRPEVIVTMNPAPSPGQHGNHQEAARLAIEAYAAAGDPTRFPEQITREGLKAFSPSRLLLRTFAGTTAVGPTCAKDAVPADPSQDVYGVYSGTTAPDGRTWAAVERAAQRQYVSQGWGGFPDVPADPAQLGCDYLTQVDSRVPYPAPGTDAATASDGALAGALTRPAGTVPLGTGLRVSSPTGTVLPGAASTVSVAVTGPARGGLSDVRVALTAPAGWTVSAPQRVHRVGSGQTRTLTFTVTAPASAAGGSHVRVSADLTSRQGRGYAARTLTVTRPVSAQQQLLPQVAQFESWTKAQNLPQLSGVVAPVLTMASGGTRTIPVTVTNATDAPQSGTVTIKPPAGFTAKATGVSYGPIPAHGTGTVMFTVTNTDTSLKTGAPGGDYAYTLTTTSAAGSSTTNQALELVPSTTIPKATTAPKVDGVVSPGEYTGAAMDLSRVWEGAACTSAADCSGTAWATWSGDTLYIAAKVVDGTLGTRLATNDCKRHWRTDSLEIAIDPRGTSENTSTTFKAAIIPVTAEGPACALRDADNHQGPAAETAPGMKFAVTTATPYAGYTAEVAIPMSELPSAIDPARMGLNILPYDSDTQDKTGQTRIGWSVWGGVQGDPYRWGQAMLEGYQPPAGRSTTPTAPIMPLTALSSLDSPQSLAQAVANKVTLAGGPSSTRRDGAWVERVDVRGTTATVWVRAAAGGTAHVFVQDDTGVAGSGTVALPRAGQRAIAIPLTRALTGRATALVGWDGRGDTTMASLATTRR